MEDRFLSACKRRNSGCQSWDLPTTLSYSTTTTKKKLMTFPPEKQKAICNIELKSIWVPSLPPSLFKTILQECSLFRERKQHMIKKTLLIFFLYSYSWIQYTHLPLKQHMNAFLLKMYAVFITTVSPAYMRLSNDSTLSISTTSVQINQLYHIKDNYRNN